MMTGAEHLDYQVFKGLLEALEHGIAYVLIFVYFSRHDVFFNA